MGPCAKRRSSWVLVLSLTACAESSDGDTGSSSSTTSATTTAESSTSGSTGTASSESSGSTSVSETGTETGEACPPLPGPDPAWLAEYQDRLVAQLSGAAEIEAGVSLPNRATIGNRNIARAYLVAELEDLGLETFEQGYDTGANVYAQLPATEDTDTALVFGAHFDTVPGSPGANDNATGVALVLALARHLADFECRTTNLLFVVFDEEEIGLVGSHEFAVFLAGLPIDVTAVHTIDQMGWDSDGDRAVEIERPDAGLFELYSSAEMDGGFGIPLTQTGTGSTDHVSFRELGFDAVGLTEEFVTGDTTPHYHQPSDTHDTVDFGYLRSTTVLVNFTIGRVVAGS